MTEQAVKKPNRKKTSYTIIDFYNSYLKHISTNPIYNVDYRLFRAILLEYFDHIMDEVLMRSSDFKLPARMGKIYVYKVKPAVYDRRHMNVNFRETNLQGELVLHFNEHSDGYRYRFHWEKKDMLTAFSSAYEMVFTRNNKRKLSYLIKIRAKDYIEK